MSIFLLFVFAVVVEKMILIVVLFTITLGVAAYSTYGERKIAAFMQDRIGPDRAPLGQPRGGRRLCEPFAGDAGQSRGCL